MANPGQAGSLGAHAETNRAVWSARGCAMPAAAYNSKPPRRAQQDGRRSSAFSRPGQNRAGGPMQAFQKASDKELRTDRELVLQIKGFDNADRDAVLAAVAQDGRALRCAEAES